MFHHGLTADHTDESAITIHHRQFLELLLGEDSGHLSDMLVQKRLILLCSIRIHTTSPRLREPPPSPISGISKIDNRDGCTTFNGEVRAVADGFKPSDGQQIKISLVLRNAQNAIIYGDIAFVDWPGNGRSTPFSITVYDLPKYVSYDLYAQIW